MASNMGFKLNFLLEGPDGGVTSNSGSNTLALPYNQQTSLTDAATLRLDINATVAASVISISKLVRSSDTLLSYAGANPNNNFNLASGEAYFVQVNADVPYISVGSHAPGLVIQLDASGDNGSASGTNFFSFPYHGIATDAASLRAEVNSFVPASVISISQLLRPLHTLQTYAGANPNNNFALVPGKGYILQVNTSVPYVPGHF
jgi:hypothetical protein